MRAGTFVVVVVLTVSSQHWNGTGRMVAAQCISNPCVNKSLRTPRPLLTPVSGGRGLSPAPSPPGSSLPVPSFLTEGPSSSVGKKE